MLLKAYYKGKQQDKNILNTFYKPFKKLQVMTSQLLTSKKEMKVQVTVNRHNAMTANNFEHVTLKNADKTPLRVRRNGKTQTWKTRPNDFKIPVKYGLYNYGYIDQYNCEQWTVSS